VRESPQCRAVVSLSVVESCRPELLRTERVAGRKGEKSWSRSKGEPAYERQREPEKDRERKPGEKYGHQNFGSLLSPETTFFSLSMLKKKKT
jgi:hypothetical protein